MNHVSVRTVAAHGSARATKDIWRGDPFIARVRNFADLNLPDLQSLRAVIETELTVKKRRDLVLDGYEFCKLCVVRDGFAARYKLLRNGKRQIVNFVLPGDVVGMPGSFLDRAANSVIAVTDVKLQICSLQSFVGLCYRRPKFGLVLSWLAVQDAANYVEHIIDVGRRTPIERLAHLLLELHSRLAMVGCAAESSFNLPFTQEMLSDALGLSAPHLNRMLTQLRAEGMIAVNEQRVEFTDLRAVQLLAQFQPVHPAQRPQFPTPIQDIALNLAFAVLGERRLNRTYSEYMTIAAKLPPLKVLTFKINEFLRQLNKCDGCNGVRLPELCRFRAGDQRVVFEPYPNHISYETVRTALEISGMREARWRKAKFL